MLAESRREKRQELPVPQTRPFDLEAKDSRRRQLEDDQETLLAEPVARPRVDVPEQIEKPDWAKDLAKSMAHIQVMMKEKGMEAPLDYTDLDLYKGDNPLSRKFKFFDMRKYSGNDDPHLHLKQYVTYMSATELTNA